MATAAPARPGTPVTGHNRLRIAPRDEGRRIDNYLIKVLKGVPRAHIYKMLRSGQVRVNGGRARADRRLAAGDEVRLPPNIADSASPAAVPRIGARVKADIGRAIVFENEDLLVVDKPSGIAVHKGTGLAWGLIDVLRLLRPEVSCLELVHRLDRATSGLILVAKSPRALEELTAQLRAHRIEKHYLALVRGRWRGGRRRLEHRLDVDRAEPERKMSVRDDGKAAEAWFEPIRRYREATLLDVTLVTGRTHQIRVQAAAEGHPLAGDSRYGDPDFNDRMSDLGLKRMFLHASALALTLDGAPYRFEAGLPADLAALLVGLSPVA